MDLRFVHTITILLSIFYVTIIEGYAHERACDAEACDFECKFRLNKEHGQCAGIPPEKEGKMLVGYGPCYCYSGPKSRGTTWCRRELPEDDCVPVFSLNASLPHANSVCLFLCDTLFQGWNWEQARGFPVNIDWCKDLNPDYRCKPVFTRDTEDCEFSRCESSCKSLYEGWSWKDVTGTCKHGDEFYCKCMGRGNYFWSSDEMVFLN